MTAVLVAAAAALLVVSVRPRQPVIDRYLVTEPTRTTRRQRTIRVPASAMVGGALGVVVAAAAEGTGIAPVPLLAVAGIVGSRVGAARRERLRMVRLEHELPTVTDALALSILAGDSVSGAIRHLCGSAGGVVTDELRAVVDSGADGLEARLRAAADGTASPQARRLYLLLAHGHRAGGRLAENLSDLADDLRGGLEHRLTAEGGTRALAVYGPILGLMIPVTLVFLMYPTLAGLTALARP
ncbi:MAG: type II secretion system F family protein [Acidimicrobiia bacterium]